MKKKGDETTVAQDVLHVLARGPPGAPLLAAAGLDELDLGPVDPRRLLRGVAHDRLPEHRDEQGDDAREDEGPSPAHA